MYPFSFFSKLPSPMISAPGMARKNDFFLLKNAPLGDFGWTKTLAKTKSQQNAIQSLWAKAKKTIPKKTLSSLYFLT